MIGSKNIGVIAAIGICLALAAALLMIGFGSSDAAKGARSEKYIDELFGDEIISINIIADDKEWKNMLENASAKEYIMADMEINGTMFSNVGVRTKGNASLSQVASTDSPERYSLHIKFDEYIGGQTCLGLDELILNNMIADSTYMKEYMSQDVMRFIGVNAPLTNYADISVNGEGFGFYVALESYGESYDMRVNGDKTGSYYNVKSMGMGGGSGGNNNMGRPPDGGERFGQPAEGEGGGERFMPFADGARIDSEKIEPPADGGEMIESPDDGAGGIKPPDDSEQSADIIAPRGAANDNNEGNAPEEGRRVRFFGGGGSTGGTLEYTDDKLSSYSAIFENSMGNVSEARQRLVVSALKALSEDTGSLEQYFDTDAILRYFAAHTVVVNLDSYYSGMAQNYVLNERDGVITMLPWDYHLSYGSFQSGSSESVVNFPIDTPVSGVSMSERPLLDKLLSNEAYLEKYHSYLREITDGYFKSGLFESTVKAVQSKIGQYVKNDSSAFYTYEQFETGVNALVRLNMLRAESIDGQLLGAIPSTAEGQSMNKAALVDASSVNMSDIGTMMGGARQARIREDADGNVIKQYIEGGPMPVMDGNVDMRRVMEILQEANGEITEDVKQKLAAFGLSDEQITMFANMRPEMGMGAMPGDRRQTENKYYLPLVGVSAAALVGATTVAARKRRRY